MEIKKIMVITITEDGKKSRLDEAYDITVEKIDFISKQFGLNYFELYGILEAIKCDLFRQVNKLEEEEEDE